MMRKNQPPPTFPGLGVPDDRRETPVVSGTPLRLKRMLAARNPRPHNNWRAHVDEDLAGQDTIALRYLSGRRQYHSVSFAADQDLGEVAGGGGGCATKHHEDTHRLFDRVEALHGSDVRKKLASHLLAKLPAEDLKTLRSFVERSYDGPADDEEHVAELVSYHNRGPSKVTFDRGTDSGMKAALKVVRQAAKKVRPEHLQKSNMKQRKIQPGEQFQARDPADFKHPTLEDVRGIVSHPLVNYRSSVLGAHLVGSFAAGKAHEHSDVDLLVHVPEQPGFADDESLTEYMRSRLRQYVVQNDLRTPQECHPYHPQWQGRRVDLYFTSKPGHDERPAIPLKSSKAKLRKSWYVTEFDCGAITTQR